MQKQLHIYAETGDFRPVSAYLFITQPTDDLSSAGGPYITRRRTTCRTAGGDVKTGEKGTERRIFRTEGQVSKC